MEKQKEKKLNDSVKSNLDICSNNSIDILDDINVFNKKTKKNKMKTLNEELAYNNKKINEQEKENVQENYFGFGAYLKQVIESKSISMRSLSNLTGINVATISRIIAEKQPPTIYHLQAFSTFLKIPLEELLKKLNVAFMKEESQGQSILIDILEEVLKDLDVNLETIIIEIERELIKLEQYAKTNEGKKAIINGFEDKINMIDGRGAIIDKYKRYYREFCDIKTDEKLKPIIGSALLYLIWTVEVVPDFIFPVGYLDDAIAIKLTEKKLANI